MQKISCSKMTTAAETDRHLDQSFPGFSVVISLLPLSPQAHFFSYLTTPSMRHCLLTAAGLELHYCHLQQCKSPLLLLPQHI